MAIINYGMSIINYGIAIINYGTLIINYGMAIIMGCNYGMDGKAITITMTK